MNNSVIIFNYHGKRDVCIVDENMLPCCLFLTNHIHSSFGDLTFNSRLSYAKTLLFIHRFFEDTNVDLVQRVWDGKFLTQQEYSDFKRHCMFKVEENYQHNVISFAKHSDKQIDNLIHATRITQGKVASQTAKMRLTRFVSYIEYLYQTIHFANQSSETISQGFIQIKKRVKRDIRGIKDQNTAVRDPFQSAIPDDVYFKLLDIIKPWSDENPFKGSRLRNRVIIAIFNDTGIREGALAKLKISNIKDDRGNFRLLITRTPDDKTDPRKKPAAQKTKAHSAAISPDTMRLLKTYIETERCKHPGSQSHDFIFIAEKGKTAGQPISLNSLYKIVETLSIAVGFKLYPHLFRIKWNEVFEIKARKSGYTYQQIDDIRKYAMGWTENSKMAQRYNEFMLAVSAQNLSKIRQQEFIPTKGESSSDNGKGNN